MLAVFCLCCVAGFLIGHRIANALGAGRETA